MYWKYLCETHLHLRAPVWDPVILEHIRMDVYLLEHSAGRSKRDAGCITHSWVDFYEDT